MSEKKKYDSTVARIAGNLLSAYETFDLSVNDRETAAYHAVAMARAIVREVERTEPEAK